MPTAEVLSQGDEVVTGQTADTNAAWLSERLVQLGFDVVRHTAVGDVVDDIRSVLVEAAVRSDLCLCTGGLGPTEDDLTAQAASSAFSRPLELDEQALAHIQGLYQRYGRVMPEVNRKQAWLPRGCTRLDNHWGTAPGFALEHGGAWLAFLPGVPGEMRALFEHRVLPLVQARFQLLPGRLVTLRTTGIGESNLQERIGAFEHSGAVLSYRTCLPENHVKLRFSAQVPDAELRRVVAELSARIGSPLFHVEGLDEPPAGLAEVVGRALVAGGHTLAAAESCTGGRLAAMCTSVPGASRWFVEGVVTYTNASKVRLLGVSPDSLAQVGAVSELVSHQMARGVREASGATYGIGITGIAGPDGGTPDKPVGTVHVALATPAGLHHRRLRLGGGRQRIQDLSASAALDLLRRALQGLL